MSNPSFTYRRRTLGRAPSPPTWACYEQIPVEDDSDTGSDNESCSEDDEEYDVRDHDSNCGCEDHSTAPTGGDGCAEPPSPPVIADKMDIVNGSVCDHSDDNESSEKAKDVKGKQRAVEPEVEDSPRQRHRRKKQREPMYTLRPILTIQKSQGFVWNQDLFIPPYIKDRYVASTSPPNSTGFVCTPASSVNSVHDYEVEVVEIRVTEGELANYIS
ncbi:hypothetical protein BD410DRAFT_819830 [Rickenella mellea]|uniref:Uncharacterized protein n=1 Tax=Rickenella mellea TaxID=50990 RepID=A0A4Y7QF95_9AGAM|nr:hypothetical protein BD410DRAFT_819830 [Rickenella mellea]